MAFIAIHAKADITNVSDDPTPTETTKKGKLRPDLAALLNEYSFGNNNGATGFLDIGNKCNLLSKNVVVNDVDGSATISFYDGYFMIYGRLIECENNTQYKITATEINNLNVDDYIVAEFNIYESGKNELNIKIVESSKLIQQNLFENSTYQMPLCQVSSISSNKKTIYLKDIDKTNNIILPYKKRLQNINEQFTQINNKITDINNFYNKRTSITAYNLQITLRQGKNTVIKNNWFYKVGQIVFFNIYTTFSPDDYSKGFYPLDFYYEGKNLLGTITSSNGEVEKLFLPNKNNKYMFVQVKSAGGKNNSSTYFLECYLEYVSNNKANFILNNLIWKRQIYGIGEDLNTAGLIVANTVWQGQE